MFAVTFMLYRNRLCFAVFEKKKKIKTVSPIYWFVFSSSIDQIHKDSVARTEEQIYFLSNTNNLINWVNLVTIALSEFEL